MRRLLALCCVLLFTSACEQTSIAEQEQIRNVETIQAGLPTPTLTPVATDTPSPTAVPPTSTPTVGPSPTPSSSPVPSPTALPPTATPNPAIASLGFCTQRATLPGDDGLARFSVRVAAITSTVETAFERITIGLVQTADSAPPSALARCLPVAAAPTALGDPVLPGDYRIQIDLAGWTHDDAFRASVITPTVVLSGTTVITQAVFIYDPLAANGAALVIPLAAPAPFELRMFDDPLRLELKVARQSPLSSSSDLLRTASGKPAAPANPIYYLRAGDLYRYTAGADRNLTKSVRADLFGSITSFAVSQPADLIAFCASSAGADAGDPRAPAALWGVQLDGSDARLLADSGRSCAGPVFSPDNSTIAFVTDETDDMPPQRTIYTLPVRGDGAPTRVVNADEWSRSGLQWLDARSLVYLVAAEDGRSSIFVRDGNGSETDIGAELLRGDRYTQLGAPLVSPDGNVIAIEAQRSNDGGADLLLLDRTGKQVAGVDPVDDVYWARPVAWGEDGTLFYLTSTCASDAVLTYTLNALTPGADLRVVAVGSALAPFGEFQAVGDALAYVTLDAANRGPYGPAVPAPFGPTTLWLWDLSDGGRAELISVDTPIRFGR